MLENIHGSMHHEPLLNALSNFTLENCRSLFFSPLKKLLTCTYGLLFFPLCQGIHQIQSKFKSINYVNPYIPEV